MSLANGVWYSHVTGSLWCLQRSLFGTKWKNVQNAKNEQEENICHILLEAGKKMEKLIKSLPHILEVK